VCPAARAGWGWSRVGGVPGLGVLDFKPLVGVVGGLSTQRGVAGRECMRMEWWLCMGRRRGGGRRTMPKIDCSLVDFAETLKRLRKELGSLAAKPRREGLNTSTWASQLQKTRERDLQTKGGQTGQPAWSHLNPKNTNRAACKQSRHM
jgi:hypothetical protein